MVKILEQILFPKKQQPVKSQRKKAFKKRIIKEGHKFGTHGYKSCYNLHSTFWPRTVLHVAVFPTFFPFQKFPILSLLYLEIQQFPKSVVRLKPNRSPESVQARQEVFRSRVSWSRITPEKSFFNSFERFPYLPIPQVKSDHRFRTGHRRLILHRST